MRKYKRFDGGIAKKKAITICIPVVDGAECVKALLPRSVPDGKIDGGSIDVQALAQERRCTMRMRRQRYGSMSKGCTLHGTLLFITENVIDVTAPQVTKER